MDTTLVRITAAIVAPGLRDWAAIFMRARRAERLASNTIRSYAHTMTKLTAWADAAGLLTVEALTPDHLRTWVLDMARAGLRPSAIRQHVRVVRCWLNWVAEECEMPPTWRNPAERVKPPKPDDTPLPPADGAALAALIATCGTDRVGRRDRAMLLTLADTGCRASELCGLDLADYDGEAALVFRRTKNGKTRAGFLGRAARRALRAWLTERGAAPGPLFLSRKEPGRLTYAGLLRMVRRRARLAGVDKPQLHGIRRLFALTALRQGVDVLSLSRLLGHSNISLVARYAKQNADDLREAQTRIGLGDRL